MRLTPMCMKITADANDEVTPYCVGHGICAALTSDG